MISQGRYDQFTLIQQLNRYLKKIKSSFTLDSPDGYCHGLALLWLEKMAEGEENWFYSTIKKAVDGIPSKDVDLFIQKIDFYQNAPDHLPGINMLDIDKILKKPLDYRFSFQFKRRAFPLDLFIKNKEMVTLSSLNHTIGVFRRDNIYHVYDANFATGCAQKIEHIRTVKQCVLDRLYRVHGKPVDPIPLHITALHNGKCARGLPVAADTFIQKNDPLSQEGVNSLYLSCVNGDEVMVKKLLEKKGNVNQRFRDDMYSPLAIAALQNHPGLVKLLLQQKAKVNLPLKKNNTALHFAAECGYAPLIQKLLSQGAAVDQRNDDGQTPLEIAKDKEEWDIVRLMKRFS